MTIFARIDAGDVVGVVSALARLDPSERQQLAAPILDRFRRWWTTWVVEVDGQLELVSGEPDEARRRAACVAGLGVATAAEVEREGLFRSSEVGPLVALVLERFEPPWVEGIARFFDAERFGWGAFEAIQATVDAGCMARPRDAGYVSLAVQWLGGFRGERLLEALRAGDYLSSGWVYRVFEVEGGPQSSPAAVDKTRPVDGQWASALARLSEDELDRGRLLDAALAATARDFAAFRAAWYRRFHDRLRPTMDERSARVDAYRHLLGSAHAQTVSFAVKVLEGLAKKDRLDAEPTLSALAPALHVAQKGTVMRAVALIRRLADTPARATSVLPDVLDAVVHPNGDVQLALLELARALGDRAGRSVQVRERLEAARPDLLPTVAARLGPAKAPAEAETSAVVDVRRRTPLDDRWALETPETLGAGVGLVARALEDAAPLLHEQAIGFMTVAGRASEDFAERTGPLVKRARQVVARSALEGTLTWLTAQMVLAWTSGEPVDLADFVDGGALGFQTARVQGLAARAAAGRTVPALATPTHVGGFVHPQAFRARWDAQRQAAVAPDDRDLVLALMRLPASARGEVAAAVESLPADVLDTALGSSRPTYVIDYAESFGVTTLRVCRRPRAPVPADPLALRLLPARRIDDPDSAVSLEQLPPAWSTTATPDDLRGLFAAGVNFLASWDDHRAVAEVLGPAAHPWVELDDVGHLFVVLSLAARSTELHTLAVDVLVDGISEARVAADRLGAALLQVMGVPTRVVFRRIVDRLGVVASTSARHADVVRRAIEGSLRCEPAPRDIHALLRLLLELLVGADARVEDPEALAWLERFDRGGHAGKCKKALLARSAPM